MLSEFIAPSRTLLLRAGGVGDFVLTLPLIQFLNETWPACTFEIIGNPAIAQLALVCGYVQAIRSIDEAFVAGLFVPRNSSRPSSSLLHYLSQFQLAISFLPDRSGTLEDNLRAAVPCVLSVPQPESGSLHASRQFLDSLGKLGLRPESQCPRVRLPENSRADGRRILRDLQVDPDKPIVAIHAGSGSTRKNWPVANFAEVLYCLESRAVQSVLLCGDADESPCAYLSRLLPQTAAVRGRSLTEVASILSFCSLILANDSGIAHLAAAVSIPVIALFGPTNPATWRPLGPQVVVVRFEDASPRLILAEVSKILSIRL